MEQPKKESPYNIFDINTNINISNIKFNTIQ